MLPQLDINQKVFFEITNPIHGGPGWEFGSCLWSPVLDHGGNHAWTIMNQVRPNDIILHLLKRNDGYYWTGISQSDSTLVEVNYEPPQPTNWANMLPYQRINLRQFNRLNNPIHVDQIFEIYHNELREILHSTDYGLFYYEYGNQNILRISQRYLAQSPQQLYNIFSNLSDRIGFDVEFGHINQIPTINEPSYPDYSPPGRTDVNVSRIVRDTQLVRNLKEEFDWRCQICGRRITLPEGRYYAEGHHLKPLGNEYQGPDTRDNIIILCPFHHAEFDYGSITINPDNNIILHVNSENEFHGNQLNYQRNDINEEFLRFHMENIFWGEY